jgi:hypothetical protein
MGVGCRCLVGVKFGSESVRSRASEHRDRITVRRESVTLVTELNYVLTDDRDAYEVNEYADLGLR